MVLSALRGSVATLALQCRVMNLSAQLRPRLLLVHAADLFCMS